MKQFILVATFSILISAIYAQKTLDYTMEKVTTENVNAFSFLFDIPVFSGVFGAEYYGFSAGINTSYTHNSIFSIEFDTDVNFSGTELSKGDYLSLSLPDQKFFDGNIHFDIVGSIKLFNSLYFPEEGTSVTLKQTGNTNYYFTTNEVPTLKNYNLRFGFGRIAGHFLLEGAVDLTPNISSQGDTHYTAGDYEDLDLVYGKSIEMPNSTNVVRIGFERVKFQYFEFVVNNPEDFSFLKIGSGKRSHSYEMSLYADVLIGVGNLNSELVLDFTKTELDNNNTILSEEDYEYNFEHLLTDSPVGIALGVQTGKYKKHSNDRLYLEVGVRPGLGKTFEDRIYGKFGYAFGFGSFKVK